MVIDIILKYNGEESDELMENQNEWNKLETIINNKLSYNYQIKEKLGNYKLILYNNEDSKYCHLDNIPDKIYLSEIIKDKTNIFINYQEKNDIDIGTKYKNIIIDLI